MNELKPLDYKILFELMKNARVSDRKMAKILGVSQATVSRRRAKLEKKGLLVYTAIPNFEKLGFEIIAFSFASWKPGMRGEMIQTQEFIKKRKQFLSKHPNVLFASQGRGSQGDFVSITVHRDYSDYAKFLKAAEVEWSEVVIEVSSFIVSVKDNDIFRQLTFKHLADYIKKE